MTQRRIYQDAYPYFVTFNTLGGEPWFEEEKYAKLLNQEMFVSASLKGFLILAFQIMPNHIHLLTGKRTLESMRLEDNKSTTERTFSKVRSLKTQNAFTISDFMHSIKGNYSRKLHIGNIWQPRFHTRIVNTRKYLVTITEYIQNNPLKDSLPKQFTKPPCQYFDWERIRDLF